MINQRNSRFAVAATIFAVFSGAGCGLVADVFRGLGTSALIFHTPVTYCQTIEGADGSSLVIPIFVFRIDSIVNNQSAPVTISPGFFYVSEDDARLPTSSSRRFRTFPGSVEVAAGATVLSPGLLAPRGSDAREGRVVPVDEGLAVTFPTPIYDPSLRGTSSGFATLNVSGISRKTVGLETCTPEGVAAEAAALP